VSRVDAETLAEVAAGGSSDAGAVPVALLGDFLEVVVAAVEDGRPVSAARLRAYCALGDRAAGQGVALRALLDLYLSATWRLWRHLPSVRGAAADPDGVVVAGEVMLHAVDDVVAALTEGYQLARRSLIRSQEAARREFVEDLLGGASDVVGVVHRAAGFGLDLTGPHAVVTIRAERGFDGSGPLVAALERSILGSKGDADALLASKDGRLVVVFAAPDRAAVAEVTERLSRALRKAGRGRESVGSWQLGVGRPRPGADGVVASYREAGDALDLAARLGLDAPVVDAADLLVHRMLLRDRNALGDLVETTLAPLREARGGAQPLLDTLIVYFRAGGNGAAAARALHLSARALTYRLVRIATLTGLDPDSADDRFTLQVAVFGAQLLGWAGAD
jgi:sugar diacid utilization regulator